MTDRDPKEMTASEQLRWAANGEPYNGIDENIWTYPTGKIRALAEAVTGEWPSDNEIFSIVADKIDAELAEARNESLRQGAVICAKANGWPDFRDGEDFCAWLYRCFIPRPRFEDGEPVQFGELVSSNLFGAVKVSAIEFTEDGTYVKDEPDGDWSTSLEVTTNRLKRPAPEVLGADGKPMKVGETVYTIDGEWLGIPLEVLGIESLSVKVSLPSGKGWTIFVASELTHESPVLGADLLPIKVGETVYRTDAPITEAVVTGFRGYDDGSIDVVCSEKGGKVTAFYDPSLLTHTPSDTQERIDGDVTGDPCNYWGHDKGGCKGCPGYGYGGSCFEAMMRDLLRRQRELDKRTGGAE